MVSVVGYGSLLSERSARETVPGLTNFRLVQVDGFKRIFNKVGIVFFSRHGEDPTSLEVASCSTQAHGPSSITCSQFECSEEQYLALYEREHRYNWVEVATIDSHNNLASGLMCTGNTDHEYRSLKCTSEADYHSRVGQYYAGKLWRNDILPYPRYLAFCLQAAEGQGSAVLDNFLDNTYLADGETTIRTYLGRHPTLRDWREYETGYSYRS